MGIQAILLSYLLLYKYYALVAVVYFSAIILPLPTNAMLLAVGAFASQGYFSFWWSLTLAVSANTAGDLTDYFLARRYGMTIIRKLKLDKVRFFNQLAEELRTDAAVNVFVTRFAGSLSPVGSFLSGAVGVPFYIFFIYDLLGNIIEPGAALALGYLAGDYWSNFSGILDTVAGLAAVGIVMFILYRIYRRIDKKYSDEPGNY
jgi:membrane protein DedA with SNARE-associated domain